MRKGWQYSAYSITKYNPIFRNDKGHYQKDEWISMYDIGKIYSGNVFTLPEYLITELKYIKIIQRIMRLNDCEKLYVRKLEKKSFFSLYDEAIHKEPYREVNKELESCYKNLKNKLEVSSTTLPYVMKIILRELSWCELVNLEKKLYVRFGYDYYMSVNTTIPKDIIKEEVKKIGLFIE